MRLDYVATQSTYLSAEVNKNAAMNPIQPVFQYTHIVLKHGDYDFVSPWV